MKKIRISHWYLTDRATRQVIAEEFAEMPPGTGARPPSPEFETKFILGQHDYCWSCIDPPPRQLPEKTLASIRQKRLARRMSKYDLLGEVMTKEELEEKKDYYSGITDTEIQKIKDNQIIKIKKQYEYALERLTPH